MRAIAIGLTALLLVSGCNSGSAPPEQNEVDSDVAAPDIGNETEDRSGLPDDILLSTNEPFWQARLVNGEVRLTGLGQEERRMRIASATPTLEGRRVRASDAQGSVDIEIRNAPCQDDMSGARFPFSGAMRVDDGNPFRGCARPGTAPPPPVPGEQPPAGGAIPAEFQGRWAPNEAGCRNPASTIEGLQVSARELRFHESLGVPTAVEWTGTNEVRVVSDYEGEGMQWQGTQTLRLSDGGNRLTVLQDGSPTVRVRCR